MDALGTFEHIVEVVAREREYQERKWGPVFDSRNTINDWVAFIARYAGRAAFAKTEAEIGEQLIKVAALAIAALETFETNKKFAPRHYDKEEVQN